MNDYQLIKEIGQIAGLGGVAIGAFLLIGRNIIAKNIFPQLTKQQSTKIIWLLLGFEDVI